MCSQTPASFEPSIDYVITKMPRFAFEKFPGAKAELTTMMKSVGETMAMGRTWIESLQKVRHPPTLPRRPAVCCLLHTGHVTSTHTGPLQQP